MRAHEIMSRHAITIGVDAPVREAIALMLSHRISGLPVVDASGKLVGILSEGDFLRRVELGTDKRRGRWLALLAGTEQIAIDFARQQGRKVGEIMSPDPVAIAEDTSVEQIVKLMESRNVKRFPVMRGGEIVGMVTRSDFLRAFANRPSDGKESLESDDRIRAAIEAALARAPWRPCALNVTVQDGVAILRGTVRNDGARKASVVAAENVAGVKRVEDQLSKFTGPAPEDEYGGGDIASLQEEPSTADDQPL